MKTSTVNDAPPARDGRTRRRTGVALAFVAAVVSGVAIFVNGLAVKQFPDAVGYTTAKNAVAAVALGLALVGVGGRRRRRPLTRAQTVMLVILGIVGGGVAFALFFEGLARATSTEAAFVQKTLVVWVMILAVPLLHERIGPLHLGAVAFLVVGQAVLAGGVRDIRPGSGEAMILAATLLWAGETVVAKRLLDSMDSIALGAARLGIGLVALLAFLSLTGRIDSLTSLSAHQWSLVAMNGAILGTYVAVWFSALQRAQAVDVTAVLVFGAVITALLATGFQAKPLGSSLAGLILVLVGTGLTVTASARSTRPRMVDA